MKSTMNKKTKKRHGFEERKRNGYRNLYFDFFWLRGCYNFLCKTKKQHDFENFTRTEVTMFFEV